MISRQLYEAQLQQIFRLLLENKSQEEIARELNISTRTVARYYQRIEKRYGEMQRQKTDNTLFTEAQLFKHRMLNLFQGLERIVMTVDRNVTGMERAKCAEIAANIAIDVLKLESEGIKAVKELLGAEREAAKAAITNNSDSTRDLDMTKMINDNESEEEKVC
jgi:IS30 family transposase